MLESKRPELNDSERRLSTLVSATTGTGSINYDPTGGYARRSLLLPWSNRIVTGIVIRSGCGTYDCSVKIGDWSVACVSVMGGASKAFGVSGGSVPVEGSFVLVLFIGSVSVGYIIGVIPDSWRLRPNGMDRLPQPASFINEMWDPYHDNSMYNVPFMKEDRHPDKILAPSNRRRDVHPGESSAINENNCGVMHGMYGVELSGGASFIRVSRIDDEIRMRSTNFQKWTDAGFEWDFNDAGLISVEGRWYSYQGELLGSSGRKGPSFKKPEDTDKFEPRPRVRFWRGFLGNLFSWFSVRSRTRKDSDDEEGLVSAHVSQGGNVMLRSTGGVSIEKYPRIPVPRRLKNPWDPGGDREIDVKHKALEKFVVQDPHSRGVVESSRMAWEQKSMYQRFDELGKDFSVKQENGLKAPGDDDKDPFGSKELDQSRYGSRKAGVFVGEDGSVILRDAWGSEIVMLGGNIFLNTPGSIMQTAHGDVVSFAGRSVVARGVEASEMSSDEGDVRIHARKLLGLAGGADGSDLGGVLIESLAKRSHVGARAGDGSDASIGGVVIRAKQSSVSVGGSNTFVSGLDGVFITTGPSGPGADDRKKRKGKVYVDSGSILLTGKDEVAGLCGTSCVRVSKREAMLATKGSSVVYGASGTKIVSVDKSPVVWSEIPKSEIPDIDAFQELFDKAQDAGLVSPYDWNSLAKKAVFSFRTSVQAKTDAGIEPWRRNREFTLYEPYWQVMRDTKDPMCDEFVGVAPHSPSVCSVNGTACWPGARALLSGKFVKYGSGNIKDGFSKNRDELSKSVQLVRVGLSKFKI